MNKGILNSIKRKILPYMLAASIAATTGYATFKMTSPEMPRNKPTIEQVVESNEVEKFALLINGDHYSHRHEANISRALNRLKSIDYDENNIISLTGEDPRNNKAPTHNYKSGTSTSLEQAVSYLRENVDNNDILLVYTTGHGNQANGKSYLCLDDKDVSAKEIAKALNKIPFGKLIFVADQCYSGGLVDKIDDLKRNIVAMSDTDEEHTTHCQPFAIGFWEAVGNNQYDANGDGKVDVREAYDEGMRRLKLKLSHRLDETNGQYSLVGTCRTNQSLSE
jgi:hypothetical protein